ncbi:MAG: DUF4157 domain-containing protein [Methylacidiphilales bacterium]|nr:DUF4157 domain-containing protein [Candidatus Methylacidiphilales bacterium]NJR16904.1 DUF4157 domain-containing protein [Calothrix sp. CSU_2_0]
MSDRTKIQRKKAVTPTYTQPSLAQKSTQDFGLSSSSAFPSHNISRISLRPQTRLSISQPGDIYEQEADAVAQQVMMMTLPFAPEPIQTVGDDSLYPKLLQRQAADNSSEISGDIESQLNATRGSGSPLPASVQTFMEPRFGNNFSNVKVHTDSVSVQMNRSLGAQAFTYGSDIYYGSGKAPGNDELTAHELTHVVQQSGGVQRKCAACEQEEKPESIAVQTSGVPNYLQAVFATGASDVPQYKQELQVFRSGNDNQTLEKYRSGLREPGNSIEISQVSPIQQVRAMGREQQNPYCFVTRQGSFMTIQAASRDEASKKIDVRYSPTEFCHDGACSVEGGSVLDNPNECSQSSSSTDADTGE